MAGIAYGGKRAPLAYGAWTCVEAVIDLDNKKASLYATDALAPELNASPVVTPSISRGASFEGFKIGLPDAKPVQGVWIDDVAYATQRIGCE